MHSWNPPSVPVLPGHGTTPKIFDTATEQYLPASPDGIYVCGITPYDATHLGHAATYVAYDTLIRVWRDVGGDFTYVQNVTDIDDPLLERASQTGVTWQELAASQVELFRLDMTALSVLPPDHYVGVVETMDLIIEGVTELLDQGAAYWVGPDLYADLSVDPEFGNFSHFDHATQLERFAERGGDPHTPGKRNLLDPLLWLGERTGEPSWDGGKLGRGRPGWHIECAIIARAYLPQPFVVQGGGEDLVFPHHEMSLSHLRLLTNETQPATVCMHAALLAYEGEKMSKSLGNLVFVSGMLKDGVDPSAIRLLLLSQHYRAEWEYSKAKLETATRRLAQWREAIAGDGASLAERLDDEPSHQVSDTKITGENVLDAVRQHLADDLDTPAALHIVDEWARSGRRHISDRTLVADVADALLGVKGLRSVS